MTTWLAGSTIWKRLHDTNRKHVGIGRGTTGTDIGRTEREMNARNIATVRTAVPISWGVVIVMVARWVGADLSETDAMILAGLAATFVHRLSLVLAGARSAFLRGVATILTGVAKIPTYGD